MWNRRRCGESFGLGWVDLNRRERERDGERSFRIDRLVVLPFSPSSPLPTYKVHVEASSLLPPSLLPQTTITTAAAVSQSEKTTTKTIQFFFCFLFFFVALWSRSRQISTKNRFPTTLFLGLTTQCSVGVSGEAIICKRLSLVKCLTVCTLLVVTRHIIRSFWLVTVSVFSLSLSLSRVHVYMYIYEKGEGEYVHASCHQPRTDSLPSLDPSRQRR